MGFKPGWEQMGVSRDLGAGEAIFCLAPPILLKSLLRLKARTEVSGNLIGPDGGKWIGGGGAFTPAETRMDQRQPAWEGVGGNQPPKRRKQAPPTHTPQILENLQMPRHIRLWAT